MTKDHVLALLRRACQEAGSMNRWAAAHGMSQNYVCDVVNGKRDPGPKILAVLGIERIVTYRKTKLSADHEPQIAA